MSTTFRKTFNAGDIVNWGAIAPGCLPQSDTLRIIRDTTIHTSLKAANVWFSSDHPFKIGVTPEGSETPVVFNYDGNDGKVDSSMFPQDVHGFIMPYEAYQELFRLQGYVYFNCEKFIDGDKMIEFHSNRWMYAVRDIETLEFKVPEYKSGYFADLSLPDNFINLKNIIYSGIHKAGTRDEGYIQGLLNLDMTGRHIIDTLTVENFYNCSNTTLYNVKVVNLNNIGRSVSGGGTGLYIPNPSKPDWPPYDKVDAVFSGIRTSKSDVLSATSSYVEEIYLNNFIDTDNFCMHIEIKESPDLKILRAPSLKHGAIVFSEGGDGTGDNFSREALIQLFRDLESPILYAEDHQYESPGVYRIVYVPAACIVLTDSMYATLTPEDIAIATDKGWNVTTQEPYWVTRFSVN